MFAVCKVLDDGFTYDVCEDDRAFPPNGLSPKEGSYGTDSTSNVVNSSNESSSRRRRVSKHVLKPVTSEDPSEQSLIIAALLLDQGNFLNST